MSSIVSKTLGGISKEYYFRNLFFGLIFFGLFAYVIINNPNASTLQNITGGLFFFISALLYPYSRFVYDTVVSFILGDNLFILPAVFMLFMKLITMTICFFFSVFISPIGFVGLYFYHSKKEKDMRNDTNTTLHSNSEG